MDETHIVITGDFGADIRSEYKKTPRSAPYHSQPHLPAQHPFTPGPACSTACTSWKGYFPDQFEYFNDRDSRTFHKYVGKIACSNGT